MQFLIVDDHPLFRDALSTTIRLAFPDATLHEADAIEPASRFLLANPDVDLVLLDLTMREVSGFDGLMILRTRFPRVPILVISGQDHTSVAWGAIQHGAAGFVSKAMDRATLTGAIADVLGGALFWPPGSPTTAKQRGKAPLSERVARLTPQQLRVMMMIRQGKLNKQIAHELKVGDSTVKAHVSEILRKLEVFSRTQIVIDTSALDFTQNEFLRSP